MGGTQIAPLRAESLTDTMARSLPQSDRPQLRNPYEAIALAVHAGMISVGFRLVGLGEDHKIPAESSSTDVQPLPKEWNDNSSYAFRYKHAQSSLEYIIKVQRLGSKAVVFAIADGDDKTANFDLSVKDYISESSLPLTYGNNTSTADAAKLIQNVFISEGRLSDLGALLKASVLQKLAPGIQKEGYEESQDRRQEDAARQHADRQAAERERRGQPHNPPFPPANEPEPARPYPFNDPLAEPPRRGDRPLPEPIPGFEDEYEINTGPRRNMQSPPVPGLGHNDLYPPGLGPHDPIRPHLGGGFAPRPGGMGGMHPTFDDPLFRGQGGHGGYNPQAPPGARYDPTGPHDPNDPLRDNRGGFPGGGGFGGPRGGGPPNPFGGFGGGDFI